ncbi:MAG: hypothetical protein AB8E15_13200 [Bdellovibrionales bacterium]
MNSENNIPIPNKTPDLLSMEKVPSELLNHKVFKELISQNKDLHSRLIIHIRRNGEQEVQIKKLAKRIELLIGQNEDLSEASLQSRELAQSHQKNLEQVQFRLQEAERELGLVYNEYQEFKNKKFTEYDDLDKQINQHKNYKRRIKKYIRPLINQLVLEKIDLMKSLRSSQQSGNVNQETIQRLSEDLDRIENKSSIKINQAEELQVEIISSYEAEQRKLRDLLDLRDIELKNSENQRRKLELIRDKYVAMENKAIAADRVRFEIERTYDQRISELRSELLGLQDKYESDKTSFQEREERLDRAEDENAVLHTQVFELKTRLAKLEGTNRTDFVELEELRSFSKTKTTKLEDLEKRNLNLKEENQVLREELSLIKNPPKVPSASPSLSKKDVGENSRAEERLLELQNNAELKDIDFDENMTEIDRLIKEIESGYAIKTSSADLEELKIRDPETNI